MASTSAQLPSDSSSSSNLIRRWSHDVFLSFRGEDTRYNFTDHLYTHLLRSGIKTFRDDRLTRGEEIQHELLKAIENSRSSIIVFSKNYAESRWCLEELAKIMECRQEFGQIVLPVFYHVNPSDVRKQTGSFGKAFTNHEINWKNKVQIWRDALTEAGNISGWDIEDGYESEFIKEISNICKRLNDKCLFVGENLVRMDSYLRELTSILKIQSNDDVQIVGILGVGGIGKTTIAKAIYNQISFDFGSVSFLENVKAIRKTGGIHDLQKRLLRDITGEKHYISNISRGAKVIQDTLQSRKALIVFDDIDDDWELLEYLVGEHHWFGRGSRVLITTRDRYSLRKVNDVFEIEGLNHKDALKLFSLYAFQQSLPEEDYKILSNDVIHYCQGLPLALKVLGSLLRGKRTSEWESELHKLKNIPNAKIQEVLKISYDELDRIQQAIFLDIACFFKGEDRNFVSKILDCCEMFAESGIGILEAKCLITVSHNKIYMHDLIQEMGWEVIRQQHPKDPNKWSRLWNPDDIYRAFISEEGMKNVETISLELSRSKEVFANMKKVFAKMKKVFAKMKKLRLLRVYYSDDTMRKKYKISLPEGFEFPRELRYLHWEGLEALPLNFDPENLVAINLKCSNIKKLWKMKKHHEKLKFVDVSDSQQLIKMPKLSSMPNLESLNIKGCTSFCKLHSSIGAFPYMNFMKELLLEKTGIEELPSSIQYLTSLEFLNVSWCSKLQKLPNCFAKMRGLRRLDMRGTRFKELPSSIGYLESLESLNLWNCSRLEKFPEMVKMKCLRELCLVRTAIKELPSSIGYLESLESLDLWDCSRLEKFPEMVKMKCLRKLDLGRTAIKELPSSIGYLESLESLNLFSCSHLEKFPEMVKMKCLRKLDLARTAIKELPSSIGYLESLETLYLSHCSRLEKFPEMVQTKCLRDIFLGGTAIKELPSSIVYLESLESLHLSGCSHFEKFPKMVKRKCLEELHLDGTAIKELPSNIGYLESLESLNLSGCSHFEKFPEIVNMKFLNSLRSLQFCLKTLDLAGCNLMEGEIPSDLWCLSSLTNLNLCENNIRSIPTGIIQLSQLEYLYMNRCPLLEEIPELPLSLIRIQAHGCPRLKTLSSSHPHPTKDLLWFSLLNSFELYVQDLRCNKVWTEVWNFVILPSRGRTGIPKWVKDKSMGCEVSIELPNKWYKDDTFLGFVLFFSFVPLDVDDEKKMHPLGFCELSISQGNQFILVNGILLEDDIYGGDKGLDALGLYFYPQNLIPNKYRSKRWKYFKACHEREHRIKSYGIHLIYAQAQNNHKKRSRNRYNPVEEESQSHHKRSRHHVF